MFRFTNPLLLLLVSGKTSVLAQVGPDEISGVPSPAPTSFSELPTSFTSSPTEQAEPSNQPSDQPSDQPSSQPSEAPVTNPPVEEHYVPGEAEWMGPGKVTDDAPTDFEMYLPYLYVILGEGGVAIPRMIMEVDDTCPELVMLPTSGNDASTAEARQSTEDIPKVVVRGVGTMELPHAFPIKVCETRLYKREHKDAWSKGDLFYEGFNGTTPIQIPADPKRFVLMADTGLRVKAKNLGLGECDDEKLYGVHQCAKNFTESDLSQTPEGDFQGLDHWPLIQIMEHATAANPDVVAYMGDYLYRQSPCPANNTVSADCAAINVPANFANTDIPYGTLVNFVPGHWGDNWFGWWADFFYPAIPLLNSTAIIGVRGNHETCERAGYGFFFLMSPLPYEETGSGTEGGSNCLDYTSPYAVPFENEQFLVMDDSYIDPENGGIDHMNFTEGACPGPPADGSVIVPVQQSRYMDLDQTNATIDDDLSNFALYMDDIRNLSLTHDTNFYVSHRPLFAVACDGDIMATLDWTMQQSLKADTLDRVVAMVGGHMHWLEVMSFVDQTLPAQLVVGHGGTNLIPNYVNQSVFPSLQLEVGPTQSDGSSLYKGRVEKGMSDSRMFGFALMDRNAESGHYDVKLMSLNRTVLTDDFDVAELIELPFELTIPKGPRVESASIQENNAVTEGVDAGETAVPGTLADTSTSDATSAPAPDGGETQADGGATTNTTTTSGGRGLQVAVLVMMWAFVLVLME